MKLFFIGAAHEVTGSCTLLQACGKNILIDSGLEQGTNIYENTELPISVTDIDAILLTHAHIDHSGNIPYLAARGFSSPVYATQATDRLCRIMLMDSAYIQEVEAEWQIRKNKRSGAPAIEPYYTQKDAQKAINLFTPCKYEKTYRIFNGIDIRFIDAGHLLGSSSIEITITENKNKKTMLFSGDLGNFNKPLIHDPKPAEKADIVVIESTYGNRKHSICCDHVEELTSIIQTTFDAGGNLVIPSFAVGRTQELLYFIRIIKEKKLIKNHDDFVVYLDSPLAVEATEIYSNKELTPYFDNETLGLLNKGINPISFKNLKLSITKDSSKKINDNPNPKIIISASGMCEAGRIRHHLKHNLWRDECTILFVGYQAENTLGRRIMDGAKDVRLFGEDIHINARIAKMESISGHADKQTLINWLSAIKDPPQMVFVNHGADAVCDVFAKSIEEELAFPTIAPYSGDGYEIKSSIIQTDFSNRKYVEKKTYRTKAASNVFERLRLAGMRLQSIIEQNKEGANKDLAKFADQINSLCEKWER